MKKIFSIAILSMVLMSCNSDDNAPNNIPETNVLTGTWRLERYTQGWGQVSYEQDEVVWEFTPNGTIIIEISDDAVHHPGMPFQESGIYSYSLEEDSQTVYISSNPYTYGFSSNGALGLVFGDVSYDDGHYFTFEKIE